MKKKILSITLVVVSFINVNAQELTDTIFFTEKWDNPLVNYMGMGIGLTGEINSFSAPIGIVGDAFVNFGPVYGGARFSYAIPLLGGSTSSDQMTYVGPVYTKSFTNRLESYLAVELYSTAERKDIEVRVNKEAYIKVPANIKTSYSIEGSFKSINTSFRTKADNLVGEAAGYEGYDYYFEDDIEYVTSFINLGVFSLGVGRTIKSNIVISTKNYGDRKALNFNRIYARLSFLTNSTLGDVAVPAYWDSSTDGGVFGYYRIKLEGHTPMQKLGFNIGVSSMELSGFGEHYFAECGIMPGPKTGLLNRAYVRLGAEYTLTQIFGGGK
jgi:hypothetical protein